MNGSWYPSRESLGPSAPQKEYYESSVNYYSHVFHSAQIFPLELLEFNNTLGKGAYGKVSLVGRWVVGGMKLSPPTMLLSVVQVYKGFIKYPNFKAEVAIKTCKRSTGYEDIEREARVFMKLKERNMNIVNLLGLYYVPYTYTLCQQDINVEPAK